MVQTHLRTVGLHREHGGLVAGGLEVEARTIFENLTRACTELDVGFNQLRLVRVYCSDFTKFGEFNVVWNEYFKDSSTSSGYWKPCLIAWFLANPRNLTLI